MGKFDNRDYIAIGTSFFITGGAKWLEHKFETNIESYESIQEKNSHLESTGTGNIVREIVEVAGDTPLHQRF
ncbi:MAG: hypothetical protein IPN89_18490 [Saprospiraceae bacterium]|nr:hypothetical protein [Saprospiraceae bacterium]